MKPTKKSQMSLFIIIGLVLVVIICLFVIIKLNMKKSDITQVKEDVVSFQRLEKDAGKYIESCIEDSALLGIETYGLNSPDILENYLEDELMLCTDGFVIYENIAEISEEKPSVNININDDIVIFDIDYPVVFESEDEKFVLEDFSYSFRTNTNIEVNNGVVEKDTFYQSKDGKVNLEFTEDTKVTVDGNKIDSISFNVEDDNIYGLKNSVVIGSVVYEALPHGTIFDPPIEVTIKLDEADIKGLDTSALKLAYYDESADLWITYPSKFDADKMVVTGLVDHFSLISVSICGSESEGTKTIPMNFVFKDPYLNSDGEEIGCEQKHWMYNNREAIHLHGNFGFHLLPEFMASLKCEYQDEDMITYHYGEEIPVEACTDLDAGYIRDWDNDDNPTYEILDGSVYAFGDVNLANTRSGGKIYLHEVLSKKYPIFDETLDLSVSQFDSFLDYVKEKCVNIVSAPAKQKLKAEFDWFTEDHVSGDSIRDGADIYCDVDLSGTKDDTVKEFMDKVNQAEIKVEFHDVPLNDNLAEKKEICWEGEGDECSALTMEWYPELKANSKTGERSGFYATPKTFGFAFEQENPFINYGYNYDKVNDLISNSNPIFSPFLGEGEYTFYLQPGGQSCVDSSDKGCCVADGSSCLPSTKEMCGERHDEKSCYDLPECEDKIAATSDPSKARAYLILNNIEVDDDFNFIDSFPGIPFASQSGEIPRATTLVTDDHIANRRMTNLDVANFKNPLTSDMSEIEARDWSCSDVCMWTINEEPGSIIDFSGDGDTETSASAGKLRSGYNTVKVRVANLHDACMYARGFIQLKGEGMSFAVQEYEDEKELTRPKTEEECTAIESCWNKKLNYCVLQGDKYYGYCCFGPSDGYERYEKPHLEYFDERECYVDEDIRPQDEMSCDIAGGYWRNGFCVMFHEYNSGFCLVGPYGDEEGQDPYAKRELPYQHFEPAPKKGCPCSEGKSCLLEEECKNEIDKYNTFRCSKDEESGQYKYCCEPGDLVEESKKEEKEIVDGMEVFEQTFPGTAAGNAEVLSAMINKCYELNSGITNKKELRDCLDINALPIKTTDNLASDTWDYTFTSCGGSDKPLQCLCYTEAIKGTVFGETELNQAWDIVVHHKDDLTEVTKDNYQSKLNEGDYVIFGSGLSGDAGHIAYIVKKFNGEVYYTDANQDNKGKVVYNKPLSQHPRLSQIKYFG